MAETLELFQERQCVNNERWAKDKPVDFLQKYSNKSPWGSSNNKTFPRANSLLSKASLQIKWVSSHLKVFRHNKACPLIRWVNSHPKDFRHNKACLLIRWVNFPLKANNRPMLWAVLVRICHNNFVGHHFPAVQFRRKIQQMSQHSIQAAPWLPTTPRHPQPMRW